MHNESMHLKPQDVVVLIKLLEFGEKRPPYAQIAKERFLSASEIHASVQRAKRSYLLSGPERLETPNKSALEEFFIHGLKYSFPPQRGELTRGVPTSIGAEPLKSQSPLGTTLRPFGHSRKGKRAGIR